MLYVLTKRNLKILFVLCVSLISVFSKAQSFSEAFGGAIISGDGNTFTFPASAEVWGGFANMSTDLYPLRFTEDGSITFTGSVADGGSADVRFRLEYKPYPDVDPAYDAAAVTVSGATPIEYTVAIPSQDANTFSSLIMYITERDVAVTVTDVAVNGEVVVSDLAPDVELEFGSTGLPLIFGGWFDDYTYGDIDSAVVTELDPSYDNSPGGLKYTKDGDLESSGIWVSVAEPIDFSLGYRFYSRIYSTVSRQINFGFSNSGIFRSAVHSGEGWQTLEFDFSGETLDDNETKMTIINELTMQGDVSDDRTIYIEGIAQESYFNWVSWASGEYGHDFTQGYQDDDVMPLFGGVTNLLDVCYCHDYTLPCWDNLSEQRSSLFLGNYGQSSEHVLQLSESIDISEYDFFRLDFYFEAMSSASIFLIDRNNNEKGYKLNFKDAHRMGFEIPLSMFSGVDLSAVNRIKVISDGDGYLEFTNWYFVNNHSVFSGITNTPVGMPLTFDSLHTNYQLTAFDGAEVVRENLPVFGDLPHQLKYVKNNGEASAGISIDLDVSVKGTKFSSNIYSNTPREITLRFDIAGIERSATHSGSGWETLSFDFNQPIPINQTRLSIINEKNIEGTGGPEWTIYIDRIDAHMGHLQHGPEVDYGFCQDPSFGTSEVSITEAFGDTVISDDGSTFTFPTDAQGWGGFANMNTDLYPLRFTEDGSITFTGSVADGGSADVRFRLEYNPHPDVDPAYDAAAVTVSGATPTAYTVAIPSQGANTFSSLIMYVVDRDVAVTITDVVVNTDAELVDPVSPENVSVTFQVDMSAVDTNADGVYIAGGAVFGQDGVLLTDNGSDVWSATVDLDMNTQVLYKFRNQPSYGTWDGFEDANTLVAGGCNAGVYNDRFVDVAEADIVLPVVAYGSCNLLPFIDSADVITLTVGDVIDFESFINIESHGGTESFIENGNLTVRKFPWSESWGLALVAPGEYIYPLSNENSKISANVYSDNPENIDMILQYYPYYGLMAYSTATHSGNGWEQLVWDFAGTEAVNGANFNVLGFNPVNGGVTQDSIFKFDDIVFGSESNPDSVTPNNQIIKVANTPKGILGKAAVLEVSYDTGDSNNQLTGIGMRVHFNSSLLSYKEITNLIEQDIIVNGLGPFNDEDDFDNDPLTDQYISFGWASLLGNWPDVDLPAVLMNIAFDVSDAIDTDTTSETSINFKSTALASGYQFESESYNLELVSTSWDFDGSGQADTLTDGLMMLRYCFGLRGTFVTDSAMSPDSTMSSEQVVAEIESALTMADIDDNSEVDALTDGLMLLRYLFGLRGDQITASAIATNANRTSNEAIEAYLEAYMPAM